MALDLNATTLLIVQVALTANLAHIRPDDPAGAGLAVADSRRRPVSLISIAHSMGVPHETIRRQALALQRRGTLQKIGAGWIVPAALLAEGPGKALVDADAAALRALSPDLVARLWNDFTVMAVELASEICGSVLDFGLYITIIRLNVEHITTDPALTRRYAAQDVIPDDRDHRPAGLRALARAEQVPYPTIRRRVAALVARGLVEEVDGGVIIPARVLGRDVHARSNLLGTERAEKLFAYLKRLGCDAVLPPARQREERCAD